MFFKKHLELIKRSVTCVRFLLGFFQLRVKTVFYTLGHCTIICYIIVGLREQTRICRQGYI